MTKVGASKTANMKIEVSRDECITEDDINKTKDNRAEKPRQGQAKDSFTSRVQDHRQARRRCIARREGYRLHVRLLIPRT